MPAWLPPSVLRRVGALLFDRAWVVGTGLGAKLSFNSVCSGPPCAPCVVCVLLGWPGKSVEWALQCHPTACCFWLVQAGDPPLCGPGALDPWRVLPHDPG